MFMNKLNQPNPVATSLLLLPGELFDLEKIEENLRADFIIAVDGGIVQADRLGLEPDLWIGDFDSCKVEEFPHFKHIPRQIFSSDKAETDTELALLHMPKDTQKVQIIGGLDGRIDHFMGLMMLPLAHPHLNFHFCNGKTAVYSLKTLETLRLKPAINTQFSIIALSNLQGLSIQGAEWDLNDENIVQGISRTLSNRSKSEELVINVKQGNLLVIVNP